MNSVVNRLAVIAFLALMVIVSSAVGANAAPANYYLHCDGVGGVPVVTYTNTGAEYLDPAYLCTARSRVRFAAASTTIDIFAEHVIPNSVVGGMQVTGSTVAANNLISWDGDSALGDQVQIKLCEADSAGTVISCFDQTPLTNATTAGGNLIDQPLAFAGASATIGAANTLVVQIVINDQSKTAYYGYGEDTGRGATYGSQVNLDISAGCSATTPADLAATPVSPTQVDLAWTYDGTTNNYYTVYRDGVQVASNIVTGSYSDTTAAAGTAYAYTVRGYNTTDTCESTDSNTANATTPTCTELTPSSIVYNGTTTAAGDFSGSSFVTLTDIGTAEYKVTESGGGAGVITKIDPWANRLGGSNAALSAGTDRLMVVAADYEYGADPGQIVVTATCNGVTFTPLVNANGREYVWIGYLTDADAATCAGNPISVDFAGGGPAHGIWQASFAGVDQATPLVDSQIFYNAAAASLSFTNLNVEAGGYAIYAFGMNGETHTPATGFTERWDEVTAGASWAGADMATPITTTINGTATANASTRVALGIASIRPAAGGEAIMIDWSSDPLTPAASTVLTNGNPYNLYARGNDTECGTTYFGDPAVANTTADGIAQAFTWSSCIEGNSVNAPTINPAATPISGAVTVDATVATGTPGAIEVSWSEDGGSSWSAWVASGSLYTPPSCTTGNVIFRSQGNSSCSGKVITVGASTAFDTTDADLATLTTTSPGTASGIVVIQTAVGVEATPGSMSPVNITIAGSSACNVAGAAMTWSGTNWEYSWNTAACGTGTAESGITIDVSGTDIDCTNVVNAPQITGVTIDNTCADPGASVSLDAIFSPISGLITVSATSNRGNLVEVSLDGTSWSASGSLNYTPPAQSSGTQNFYARTTDNCAIAIFDTNNPTNVAYETRTASMVIESASASQSSPTSISVNMPYKGDFPNNGRFTVAWKLNSDADIPASWTTVANAVLDTGGISPFSLSISGLTTSLFYDVRVTYADVDGTSGQQPIQDIVNIELIAWIDNPLLHNSLRFACSEIGYNNATDCVNTGGGIWSETGKWATGWGTSTGEYGPILCSTCHIKATTNIKRIQTVITASSGTFPSNGATVTFQSVSGVNDSFGDDAGGHATSTKVCETCHSQNQYHNYDTANNTGGLTHQNQNDCIGCHTHKTGFRASCTSCHANPPVDASGLVVNGGTPADATGAVSAGAHNLHTTGSLSYDCNVCHTGWENAGEMPKAGSINIGFVPFAVNDAGALYKGRNGGAGYLQGASTTVSQDGTQTCAVYCHGDSLSSNVGDWDANTGGACGDCHAVTAGTISGLPSGASHSTHVNGQGLTCNQCHGAGYSSVAAPAGHVNGSISYDVSGLPGTSPTYAGAVSGAVANWAPSASYGNCSNISCHGAGTPQWGATLGCDSCHGYPPTGAGGSTDHFTRTGKASTDAAFYGAHADCSTCHGVSGNATPPTAATARAGYIDLNASGGNTYVDTMHNDGKVQMNGYDVATANGADDSNAGYDGAGGCTAACHAQSVKLSGTIQANTVELREFGSGACTSCHDGSGAAGTATAVSDSSPHALATTSLNCEDCHGAHGGGTIEIPNNPTVGINYTGNGEGGIALGVAGTAPGATEAEICWNCHDAQAPKVSEWGTNNNADGITYNYGSLSASNWTTATWTSGTGAFGYKAGAIKSTHSANTAGTSVVAGTAYSVGGMTETVDAVANIRCSYCHDVHDLNSLASDTSTGKPYLRGTWKGNPYNEDGAPQSGMTGWDMTGTLDATSGNATLGYGAVPRASVGSTNNGGVGGYWIDQNSGNPNNGETLASTAGLCTLCHGSDVDNMDVAAGQGNAGSEGLWIGTNGHSNAVIGGTGSAANNIFTTANRGGPAAVIKDPNAMDMGAWSENDRGLSYRGSSSVGAYAYQPAIIWDTGDSNRAYAYEAMEWGDAVTIPGEVSNAGAFAKTAIAAGSIKLTDPAGTTAQTQYHTFNCGKCHNPHASRLPKLMITNCLDTNHNTWQDTEGSVDADTGVTTGERNANWMTAQNCHRRGPTEAAGEGGSGTAWGAGWNKVTPW